MKENQKKKMLFNLMDGINDYHTKRRICLFVCKKNDVCDEHHGIKISISNFAPWLSLLKEHKFLHVPAKRQNVTSSERHLLDVLGSDYIFMCAIFIKKEVVGFVCMDDSEEHDEKYEIPISYATFLSNTFPMKVFSNQEYYEQYLQNLDITTFAFSRTSHLFTMLKQGEVSLENMGIIHVDFNEMRVVNEQYGTTYGDIILKETAKLLINTFAICLGQVYRISGDEFLVVCLDCEQDLFLTMCRRLKKSLQENKALSMAIGTTWHKQVVDIACVLTEVEKKMKIDKEKHYENKRKEVKNLLKKQIHTDLQKGLYEVYLQSQIDINSGKLIGAEALVRKMSEDGIIQMPDSFIPLFEKEKVIKYIDFFVLTQVAKLIAHKEALGSDVFTISVNFSRVTLLEKHIVSKMKKICEKYHILTNRICIEITESMNELSMEEIIPLTQEIKQAGFLLSLDDYGTAYSNITILSSIDFDEIKLDKSIIQKISHNDKARTIVKNLISMCKDFRNTMIIAEGIETKETLDLLKAYHCDGGQGYYFSKPISIYEFKKKYVLDGFAQIMYM